MAEPSLFDGRKQPDKFLPLVIRVNGKNNKFICPH
jgi:hypothetical protein